MQKSERTQALISAFDKQVLVLDGAQGTVLQSLNLCAEDFGGPQYEGCYENLVFTHPELIQKLHEDYLQAGADIIQTLTFESTPWALEKYGLAPTAEKQSFLAAQLARKLADKYSTPQKLRFVAGVLGPTSVHLSLPISASGSPSVEFKSSPTATFESLEKNYYLQAKALYEGGADYLLFETCQDTLNIKAGICAAQRLFTEKGESIPIAVSVTLQATETLLAGQSIEALIASLAHTNLLYLGLNCATGPEFMTSALRTLARLSPFRVACVPNAGLPDENGCYLESPSVMAKVFSHFLSKSWLNLIGGCCGTHAEHIRALADLASSAQPRVWAARGDTLTRVPETQASPLGLPASFLSGIHLLEIKPTVLVGDALRLKSANPGIMNSNALCEKGREQIKIGAQVLELSLASLQLDEKHELKDMRILMEQVIKKITSPILISSRYLSVLELALSHLQGKCLIRFKSSTSAPEIRDSLLKLLKNYGASLVLEIPKTQPLKAASWIYEHFCMKSGKSAESSERWKTHERCEPGLYPEELYWDLSSFSSNPQEALQTLQILKEQFPRTRTLLDISKWNPSSHPAQQLAPFTQAGLDLAIVDPSKFLTAALATQSSESAKTPLDLLTQAILEGSKTKLPDLLKEALKTLKPLEIIHGPLMDGMNEVRKRFSASQLIVAEVLQSAEAMKAAIAFLEPFLEKSESANRGTVILATVQGDVHDIGKNLVEIILSNNGFKILNLGNQVTPERLIQAIQEHQPDIIGLSGLLVKSAHQMVTTAADLSKAGITIPLLVGGAALSSQFVDKKIAEAYSTGTVIYAQDAMSGLDLANTIVDSERFEIFKTALLKRRKEAKQAQPPTKSSLFETSDTRSSSIPILSELPQPVDLERHLLKSTPIDQIWNYINILMLYGRHLGIRGKTVRLLEKSINSVLARKELESQDPKAVKIWDAVQEVKDEYRNQEVMHPSAIYQFFRAASQGNALHLFPKEGDTPCVTFDFPRQRKPQGLCLADYVTPLSASPADTVGVFIVSVGKGVRPLAETLKNQGNYLKSHILQALALESAEAYAELLHSQLRKSWGYPDPPETTMMDRFQAKYRGKRYSFGYPACPNLEDQSLLWKLLQPQDIGVQLTDGFMMDPEATVSALAFHHPMASYFSVGPTSLEGSSNEDNRA